MAEADVASTTGAELSANIRRRNVQNVEGTSSSSTTHTTGDDGKKVKSRVCEP